MRFTLVKILLVLTLIFSAVEILYSLQIIDLPQSTYLLLGYGFLTLLTVTVAYIALLIAGRQKPREIVKVIYKTPTEEKKKTEKEAKKPKEQQVIKKYVDIVTLDLDKYNKSLEQYSDKLFQNLAKAFNIVTGVMFSWNPEKEVYYISGRYAFYDEKPREYRLGDGLPGQVAKDKRILYITNVPEGYIVVLSGLGKGTPRYLIIMPVVVDDFTQAVIEFATFEPLPEPHMKILENIAKELSKTLPK
jgi:ABC-type multidrug transport system fused ATPase/permease subunit